MTTSTEEGATHEEMQELLDRMFEAPRSKKIEIIRLLTLWAERAVPGRKTLYYRVALALAIECIAGSADALEDDDHYIEATRYVRRDRWIVLRAALDDRDPDSWQSLWREKYRSEPPAWFLDRIRNGG